LLAAGLACIAAPLAFGQSQGEAAGDPAAGRALAQRWCSSCHVVDPDAKTGTSNGVPTFASIAAMPSTTQLSLHVFLQTSHGQMPNLLLSRSQIDDVVAYIVGLK
jgi:mono/diheme cytochrome c family protein